MNEEQKAGWHEGPLEALVGRQQEWIRPACTCHIDDRPPFCPGLHAHSECKAKADEQMLREARDVLAAWDYMGHTTKPLFHERVLNRLYDRLGHGGNPQGMTPTTNTTRNQTMNIIEEIDMCAVKYEMSTGVKPTRVYLGRREMLELGKWAHANGFAAEPTSTAREGMDRPELFGLKVYMVNDDKPHMRCCA